MEAGVEASTEGGQQLWVAMLHSEWLHGPGFTGMRRPPSTRSEEKKKRGICTLDDTAPRPVTTATKSEPLVSSPRS